MPSDLSLVKKVADYCWSNNFLDVFHKFFADHADAFETAPDMTGGEHNMEYYSLFQKYLEVYESTLTTFVDSLQCSIEDFYKEVRLVDESNDDPYLRVFVDCLLASADYESFYKVMVKEGRKRATKKTTEAKLTAPPAKDIDDNPKLSAPASVAAERKSTEREEDALASVAAESKSSERTERAEKDYK